MENGGNFQMGFLQKQCLYNGKGQNRLHNEEEQEVCWVLNLQWEERKVRGQWQCCHCLLVDLEEAIRG